jgi:hypothetical protein
MLKIRQKAEFRARSTTEVKDMLIRLWVQIMSCDT